MTRQTRLCDVVCLPTFCGGRYTFHGSVTRCRQVLNEQGVSHGGGSQGPRFGQQDVALWLMCVDFAQCHSGATRVCFFFVDCLCTAGGGRRTRMCALAWVVVCLLIFCITVRVREQQPLLGRAERMATMVEGAVETLCRAMSNRI